MLGWILLIAAAACLALGLLNTVMAPPWSAWQLGVITGEFGHWLAILPIGVAVVAWVFRNGAMPLAIATTVVAFVAAALLLKPVVQARGIGRALPEVLAQRFGPQPNSGAAFSFVGLAKSDPPATPFQTLNGPGDLPLDFYRPVEPLNGTSAPCVIVIHGGGWDSGDRRQLPEFNYWLARQGYAVAAISYRLAPQFKWPAQRDDVLAAIAFLKERAKELGIDASRFVLLGRSAGGQIAQVVAYTARDPAIRGLIALYAPGDLYFGYVNTHENDMLHSPALMRQYLGGPPETARAAYESASAQNCVHAGAPPTLLLHGHIDPLVWHRHSVRLDARLAELGVPRAFVSLPWATHAFDYNLQGPGGQLTTFAVEWFLRSVTR